jgi:hypothetical protein
VRRSIRPRRSAESLEALVRRLTDLSEREPERRLLAAMLLDAIEDLRAPLDTGDGRRADVLSWVAATDVCWPLSFVTVCGALDADAVALRALLLDDAMERSRL